MTSRSTEPATGAGHTPDAPAASREPVPPTEAFDPHGTVTLSIATALVAGQGTVDAPRDPPPVRYRPIRVHARGGLGQVSLAHDLELDRPVALKEIHAAYADQPSARARFVLEAEITGKLEHPGVVPVYGLGYHADGRPYYAMRFVQGESLKDAIARIHADCSLSGELCRRMLSFRELLGRFLDVCNAIGYAHSRGVIHRDLKPSNVMLGSYGETLVVDWGVAKTLDGAEVALAEWVTPSRVVERSTGTISGSAVGTPAYMSPEQARGDLAQIGPACDIYGLGATLFTLLTGEPPVAGDDTRSILDRVARGEIRVPSAVNPRVPRSLDAICRKAMAPQPEDRYASARDLAGDVKRWLADEPVGCDPEPPAKRLGRWLRRHRLAASVIAACGLTGLGCGVAGVVLLQRSQWETEHQRQIAQDYEATTQTMVALLEELTKDADLPLMPAPPAAISREMEIVSAEPDQQIRPKAVAPPAPVPPPLARVEEQEIAKATVRDASQPTEEESPLKLRYHRVIAHLEATGRLDAAQHVRAMVHAYDARMKQRLELGTHAMPPSAAPMLGD
jgi:serine/threonine-protein kinase